MSSGAVPPTRQPDYRKHDHASLLIATESATGGHEYIEEREQEEYYYVHSRPQSEASESATINFLTDDRVERRRNGEREPYEEEFEEIHEQESRYFKEQHTRSRDPPREQRGRAPGYYGPPPQRTTTDFQQEHQHRMSVDYSPQDFQHSRQVIESAARSGDVRVRQVGDTTIMTEHRDPYSFYWQLDQFKKQEEPPPRRLPPADYVVDEEEILPPQETTVLSPDSHDSGIQFESQYSRPHKEEVRQLPAGWEKHEDPSGFSYYWHVDSGTITREPPKPPPPHITPPPAVQDDYTMTEKIPSPPPIIQQLPPPQPVIEEHAFKQTTTKRRVENDQESDQEMIDEDRKPVRFVVRSLGWTEIAEEELTAERSSRAVNRAIIELSTGLMDNVAKWGDGRELIMELDDNELRLIDPDTMSVVHAERIQQIRVWGVGRDNGRDFAYVARDKNSRRFLCHVFRCDTPARTIANTLRDICKRLMLQRRPTSLNGTTTSERRITKESLLPTPIDEPKKIIRCHFLGVTQVPRATGIDILNEAVNRLVSQVRPERWILADVSIAPSTITINEVGGGQIAQCRVRYLSFLGIGQDVKHCAFIMHTSTENFMCYVFHVEPSAGAMAKTIEAACKLRYQKVLDAHANKRSSNSQLNGKDWGESLKDVWGSFRERLSSFDSSRKNSL